MSRRLWGSALALALLVTVALPAPGGRATPAARTTYYVDYGWTRWGFFTHGEDGDPWGQGLRTFSCGPAYTPLSTWILWPSGIAGRCEDTGGAVVSIDVWDGDGGVAVPDYQEVVPWP